MTQNPNDPQQPEGTPPAHEPNVPPAPEPGAPAPDAPPVPPAPPAPPAPDAPPAPPAPPAGGYGAPPPPSSAYPPPSDGGFAPPPPPGPGPEGQYGQPGPGYGTPPPPPPGGGFPAAPPAGGYGDPGYGQPGYGQAPWGGQPPFSVGAAVSYGWNAWKSSWGPFVGVTLLVLLVGGLINVLLNPSFDYSLDAGDMSTAGSGGFGMAELTFGGQLLAGLSGIISFVVGAILTQGAVHKVNGRFDGFGAFFRFDHAGPLFLSAILLGAVNLVIGLLSVVIPVLPSLLSLVWSILTVFTLYVAADRGVQPVAAVQESFRLVTGNLGSSIVLILATAGITILGFLALCVGILIALPVVVLAWAFAYKSFSGQQVAPSA